MNHLKAEKSLLYLQKLYCDLPMKQSIVNVEMPTMLQRQYNCNIAELSLQELYIRF